MKVPCFFSEASLNTVKDPDRLLQHIKNMQQSIRGMFPPERMNPVSDDSYLFFAIDAAGKISSAWFTIHSIKKIVESQFFQEKSCDTIARVITLKKNNENVVKTSNVKKHNDTERASHKKPSHHAPNNHATVTTKVIETKTTPIREKEILEIGFRNLFIGNLAEVIHCLENGEVLQVWLEEKARTAKDYSLSNFIDSLESKDFWAYYFKFILGEAANRAYFQGLKNLEVKLESLIAISADENRPYKFFNDEIARREMVIQKNSNKEVPHFVISSMFERVMTRVLNKITGLPHHKKNGASFEILESSKTNKHFLNVFFYPIGKSEK